jgi:hypothetical protein
MHQMSDVNRRPAANTVNASTAPWHSHQLYFKSLSNPSRALSFPCDGRGLVQLDALCERARNNYFFARAAVGRDYGRPIVIAPECCPTH